MSREEPDEVSGRPGGPPGPDLPARVRAYATGLRPTQRRALERAWHRWVDQGGVGKLCGAIMRRGPEAGYECPNRAGLNTIHEGYGPCFAHGGATMRGIAEGAWIMGHELAQQMNVTPWGGILLAVKRAAGEVAWYDSKIAECTNDDDLRPSGEAYDWVMGSRQAVDKLARYSKMAIDAGVAERIVRQVEVNERQIATALLRTLSALGLSDEQEDTARAILRRELLAIESTQLEDIIDGEVTS